MSAKTEDQSFAKKTAEGSYGSTRADHDREELTFDFA